MSEQKNDASGWVDSVLGQMGLVFHLRGLVGVLDYSFRRAALHQEEQKLREMLETRAALSAPAVPKWIPVSERLPEEGQQVLYYFNVVGPWVGHFVEGTHEANAVFAGRAGFLTGDVTHWMPLPAAPQPQEQTP